MDIKKIITVKFSSNSKLAGETTSNINYYVDWSAILKDNQPYELTYSYTAQKNTFTADTKIASLYINIFGENYMANSPTTPAGATPTQQLCFLSPGFGNWGLSTDLNSTLPIYLRSRPQNNVVNIRILNNDNPPTNWLDNATVPVAPGPYILTLYFKEI